MLTVLNNTRYVLVLVRMCVLNSIGMYCECHISFTDSHITLVDESSECPGITLVLFLEHSLNLEVCTGFMKARARQRQPVDLQMREQVVATTKETLELGSDST